MGHNRVCWLSNESALLHTTDWTPLKNWVDLTLIFGWMSCRITCRRESLDIAHTLDDTQSNNNKNFPGFLIIWPGPIYELDKIKVTDIIYFLFTNS